MPFRSLGYNQLGTLTSAVGFSQLNGTGSISSSTNANPIVLTVASHNLLSGSISAITAGRPLRITSTAHGLSTGDRIIIDGVGGTTSLNSNLSATAGTYNTWSVQVVDANNFTVYGLKPVDFDATYTSGGYWYRPVMLKVENHATNTNANASWAATTGSDSSNTNSSTKIRLLGSTGNGVGAGTGTWRVMPHGTNAVLIQALVGTVNWREDGTDPTTGTSGGNELYAGDEPFMFTGDIWRFKAINQTASSGAVLNCEFVRI